MTMLHETRSPSEARRILACLIAKGTGGRKNSTLAEVPRAAYTGYSEMGLVVIKECRWPMWPHDSRPTHVFCCAPTRAGGSSYCEKHHAMAWRTPGEADPNYVAPLATARTAGLNLRLGGSR